MEGGDVLVRPEGSGQRAGPIPVTSIRRSPDYAKNMEKKNGKKGKRAGKAKLFSFFCKRGEKDNLMNSLAQEQDGIAFGQIIRGGLYNVRRDLMKLFQGRPVSSKVIVEVGYNDNAPRNRHQVVNLTVFCSPGLRCDSERDFVEASRQVEGRAGPDGKRIIVVYGATSKYKWVVINIPVGFGSILSRLKLFFLKKVPLDLIIGAPTLA